MSTTRPSTQEWRGAYTSAATLIISSATVLLAGCGDSKFQYAPVSGQVVLDGNPVANARIVFMPQATSGSHEAGPYSNGETDAEGRYQLQSVASKPREGAVVGPHRVIISTRKSHLDADDPDIEIIDSPETIPTPYTHYKQTPLTFNVPLEGSAAAIFELDGQFGKRPKKRR